MSQAIINAIKQVREQANKLEVELSKALERLEILENRKKPGPKPKDQSDG